MSSETTTPSRGDTHKHADRLYDLLWLLLLVLAVLLTLLLTGCTSTTECWYEGGKHICSTRFDG